MNKIVGIDPGKDGFVAILLPTGEVATEATQTVPVGKTGSKRDYDIAWMVHVLAIPDIELVVIEKQQAMPQQGVSSTFSIGRGFGLWEGIVAALEKPHVIVHPRTWQKVMHRDVQGDNTKSRSILAASRLFPAVDLRKTPRCKKPHDGKADAMLLAWYGRHYVLAGSGPQEIEVEK